MHKQFFMNIAQHFNCVVIGWKSFINRMTFLHEIHVCFFWDSCKFQIRFIRATFACLIFMYAFWWMLKSWYIRWTVSISNFPYWMFFLFFFFLFFYINVRQILQIVRNQNCFFVCLCVYFLCYFFREGVVCLFCFLLFEGERRFRMNIIYNTNHWTLRKMSFDININMTLLNHDRFTNSLQWRNMTY